MMKTPILVLVAIFCILLYYSPANAQNESIKPSTDLFEDDPFENNNFETAALTIKTSDPLEGYNRVIHAFNDKLYFYFLKPVSKGYGFIIPKSVRASIKRVFRNAAMPGRFINCLLQGKFVGAGTEIAHFAINTTFGLGGIFNPAKDCIQEFNEDTGQTLGTYGIGTGIYIVWPFLGPSTLRGTVGTVMDSALDPLTYVQIKTWERGSVSAFTRINDTSLRPGEYEQLKESSIDPYIAVRNAYLQYRQNAVHN